MSTRRLGSSGSDLRLPALGRPGSTYTTSAPSNPQIGDLWVDSDAASATLNSSDYALVTQAPVYQASAPTTPAVGQLWVNSGSGELTVWTGSAWTLVSSADDDNFLLMGA